MDAGTDARVKKSVDANTDARIKKSGGRRHRRRSKENWWTQTQTQE